MATIYEQCGPAVPRLALPIITENHASLLHAGVVVEYVFARSSLDDNGDPVTRDPLKLHGVPAYAIARVIKGKDRALGRGDVEICIDQRKWEEMPERRQKALLDHELTHFELAEGRDEYDRPKIKMRPHDRDYGWFDCVARRHGADSIEVDQAQQLALDAGKTYFQSELALL